MRKCLAALLLTCSPTHTVEIACGGYSPAVNDHVEWSIKVTGTNAYFDGQHFKARESKRFLILTGPHRQIRINKSKMSYVILVAGKAVEWSRKTPGEGCDFSH
jgi:hypothetical protein